MAQKGKRRSRATKRSIKRSIFHAVSKSERAELKRMAKFIPSLKEIKPKRGKTFKFQVTPQEYSRIKAAKKQLRHTENLRPVTEKQAKILRKKGLLAGRGVRAVRLRSTAENAKVKVHKDGVIVTSNGRTFEYHPFPADIDALAEGGETLLDRKDVKQIFLWTNRGRTDEGFTYFGEGEDDGGWLDYLQRRFAQYHAVNDFVEGIAAEIKRQRSNAVVVRKKENKKRG